MPPILVRKQLDQKKNPTNFINILRNSRKRSKDEPTRNHENQPSIEVVDLEPETVAGEQQNPVKVTNKIKFTSQPKVIKIRPQVRQSPKKYRRLLPKLQQSPEMCKISKGVGDEAVTSRVQISEDLQRNLNLSSPVANEPTGTKYFVWSGAERGRTVRSPKSRSPSPLSSLDVSALPPTSPDPLAMSPDPLAIPPDPLAIPPDPLAMSSGPTSQCFFATERMIDLEAPAKVRSLDSEAPAKVRSLESEAPANVRSLESEVPANVRSLESEASAKVRSLESEASAKVRSLESEAPANVRSFDSEAPANVRSLDSEAPANVRSLDSEAPANVRSLDSEVLANIRSLDSEAPAKVRSSGSDAPAKFLLLQAKHDYRGPSRKLYVELKDRMPNQWDIRMSSEGAHALLWAEGIPSAIQREIFASFDGSALSVVVHSRTLPSNHEVYKSLLMKPTLRLTLFTVEAFADVIMSALHAVQDYRTCCGIGYVNFIKEWTQHPECRLDENRYREPEYSETLRPLDCRLLLRSRKKRCDRCDHYVDNSENLRRAERECEEKAKLKMENTKLQVTLPAKTTARILARTQYQALQRKKRLLSRLRAAPRSTTPRAAIEQHVLSQPEVAPAANPLPAIPPPVLWQGAIALQVKPPAAISQPENPPPPAIPPQAISAAATPLAAIPRPRIRPAVLSQRAIPPEAIPPEAIPTAATPPAAIPRPRIWPAVLSQRAIPPEAIPQEAIPTAATPPAAIPRARTRPAVLPQRAIQQEVVPPAAANSAFERARERITKLLVIGSREIDLDLLKQLSGTLSSSEGLVNVLWREQRKLNAGKATVKLHPFLLRWALNVKTLYSRGYQAMRTKGWIQLPNGRSLHEYYVSPSKLGVQEHALTTIAEHRVFQCDNELLRYHIVFIEEVYVYMNVVYQKSSGEVLGYVRLDQVEAEWAHIEREICGKKSDCPPQYSKILLSYLVKGVTNGIRSVVACHAGGVSLEELDKKTWQVVENLEARGIKVIALVGVGNLVNQLFKRYQPLTHTDSRVVFDTKNVYSDDGRPLFLLNDFSELLKQIRNCFANSGAHKQTRLLTKNGETISWQTILEIFQSGTGPRFEKITPLHVFLNSNSIIKWHIAAQTMSRSVAAVIEERHIAGTGETVKFIRYINDVNDCLSGTHQTQASKKKNLNLAVYRSESDYRFFFLMEFLGYLKKWEEEVRELPLLESERKKRLLSPQVLTETERTVRAFVAALKYLLGRRKNTEGIMASVFQENPLEYFPDTA